MLGESHRLEQNRKIQLPHLEHGRQVARKRLYHVQANVRIRLAHCLQERHPQYRSRGRGKSHTYMARKPTALRGENRPIGTSQGKLRLMKKHHPGGAQMGQRAILVGNLYSGPKGPGLVLVTDDTTLANAGLAVHEPVALRDGEGALRSTYRAWPDPLVAPDPALTEAALVRVSPDVPDSPEAWSFAAPTPGV